MSDWERPESAWERPSDKKMSPIEQSEDSLYRKYVKSRTNVYGDIPGWAAPTIMSKEDWRKSKEEDQKDFWKGMVETPLSIGSSVFAQIPALGQAAAKGLVNPLSDDAEKEYKRVLEEYTYQPRSRAGQKATEYIGRDLLGAFGPTPYIPPVIGRGKVVKPPAPAKDFASLVKDDVTPVVPETQIPIDAGNKVFNSIAESQLTGWNEPLRPEPRSAMPDIVAVAEQQRMKNADATIAARQAALEQEVARQTSLDMNAAERARQEQAGTGYENWQANKAVEEAKQTHDFLSRAKQDEINGVPEDPPFAGTSRGLVPRDAFTRIDENGMPIRADLSMEAQNLQNPLQRNLWGDELPMRTGDGGIPLTQALDKMPEGWERTKAIEQLSGQPAAPLASRVMDKLGGQRGAIDVKTLEDGFNKIKTLANGIVLHAYAEGDGQLNVIASRNGEYVGSTRMSPENYRNPKPKDFMSSLTTKSHEPGLATEMYKFVSELGNDIIPSKSQTPAGKSMWEGFERKGMTKNVSINGTSTKQFQRGGVDFERILEAFKGRKQFPSVEDLTLIKPQLSDSIETPRSAPLVAARNEMNSKAQSVPMLAGTPYARVTTPEQVLAAPGKDIRPSYTGIRNKNISGVESLLRLYPDNKLLNFTRTVFQDARNKAEVWSKEYLTGKDGINSLLNKLDINEKNDVVGLLLELDKAQRPLTDVILDKVQFNDNQKAVAVRIRESLDHLYAEKTKSLGEQGFESHLYRQGYVPANFGGAYKTLVGHYGENGQFKVMGVAQADTLYGLKKAEAYYKKAGDKYSVAIPMDRQGYHTSSRQGRNADAWATLVAKLAEHDPEFAKVKAAADQAGADAAASLYDYHLHEKKKAGVSGSLGDRPWLDRDTNTKEFISGLIDYLEDGFRYTAYQNPLNDVTKLLNDPKIKEALPNATAYVEQYKKHIVGENLHPIGAGLNWGVDTIAKTLTLGNGKINKFQHELSHWSALHMMGTINPGFFLMQLTQVATGGIPEAMQLRNTLGLKHMDMADSAKNATMELSKLAIEGAFDKTFDVPQHMRDAYGWAQNNGLFTFSEAELAHQVLQSKTRKAIDSTLDMPIRYGELTTRPAVFMWYADMFHKAGFKGDEMHSMAQSATDFAMANYHPDERPMLYNSLGAVGSLAGALSTYKHNFVNQAIARTKGAAKNPGALLATLGLGYALYGLGGFPGSQEASWLSEKLTDKTLREQLLSNPRESSSFMDGVLTATTGIDFQSRLSMSSVLPDSPLSVFPHISNIYNVTDKAIEFAMHPDKGSAIDAGLAVTPAGMRGIVEQQLYPDGKVLDRKSGMNKYEEPRTKGEQQIRSLLGVRPAGERMADERTYANQKIQARQEEKQKQAMSRFDRAFVLSDGPGMDKAYGEYLELGGDAKLPFDNARLAELAKKSGMSNEQRKAGIPKDLKSVKKYENYMTP